MKRIQAVLALSGIGISLVIIFAVCWHAVEEIHYLKGFYPAQFSVKEAFYASLVELIKVAIISFPLALIIGIGLWLLNNKKNPSE